MKRKAELENVISRCPRSSESHTVRICIDEGKLMSGENYYAAKAAIKGNIAAVVDAWGASLGTSELDVGIDGNHFDWDLGDGVVKCELVCGVGSDRLRCKGRGVKAKIADGRAKLRRLYEEGEDLFCTVMLGLMCSGKVTPHFCEIRDCASPTRFTNLSNINGVFIVVQTHPLFA